jgi:ribulose 1,5-bisphosphate synthetase/thiazole synthase
MILQKQKFLQEEYDNPVRRVCDVLVVGGGSAGISAAVAAARKGAGTILLERHPLLGGDMLAGGLSWLSYFNVFREFNAEPKQVVFGIAYEIAKRLMEEGSSPGFYEDMAQWTQESRGTHADRERIKGFFYELVEENGIELYLNSLVADTVVENGAVKGVVVQTGEERFAILAKVVIDASGDGDVACHAGANCREYPSHGVGMAFGLSNIDLNKTAAYGAEKKALTHLCYGTNGEMTDKLVKCGIRTYYIPELMPPQKECQIHNSFCVESAHEGEATYVNGVNTYDSNILDPRKSTDTLIRLRENIFKSVKFLNTYIPGFEHAHLNWTSQIAGARQTRYVECRYDISADDITYGVIPEDSIGLFGGQDAHYAGHVIKEGKWYGIPYRALIPKYVGNLLVVGRMLSSDFIAYMSTRLTIACMIQGQAAGTAAVLSMKEGCAVADVDVKELREILRNDGVYLG